jgi:hypothetical protein
MILRVLLVLLILLASAPGRACKHLGGDGGS